MTLLAEPLFVGTLDASEHDITITACNNAGFALPFTGGAGFTIYILFAALMLGMGVGTGCLFLQKNHDEKGELNHEENETTLGAASGHGHGLGAYQHSVRSADH